jgi:uncharacterized protein
VRWSALARTGSPLLFDHILKRPAAAMALVAAMEEGRITPAALGPGNVARLRTHPNRDVAREASALLDKLVPQAQKGDVIASVLPHVDGPADPERGRNLFVGACGACHRIGDVGTGTIGPPLNGMGAHGRAELLAHIIDPNREVDPSFWQWNVTTKGGQTLSGVIVSESGAGLTLRTEGGRRRLQEGRDRLAREHAPIDDARGARGARIRRAPRHPRLHGGRRRAFRIVDLRQAYTADSRRGLRREEDRDETVTLHRFGDVTVAGVPFFVMDPARSTTGLNFIALKSGPNRGNALDDLPSRVEIPSSVTASSLHFLGGVGGWAWPHGGDAARGTPVMRVVATSPTARARSTSSGTASTSPTSTGTSTCRSACARATSRGAASCATSRSI